MCFQGKSLEALLCIAGWSLHRKENKGNEKCLNLENRSFQLEDISEV